MRRQAAHDSLAFLEHTDHVSVKQRVEPVEVVFGLQVRNRYEIRDRNGEHRLSALELAGGLWSWVIRQYLKGMRPFRMEIRDLEGGLHLKLRRPFRFFFFRLEVQDAEGRLLGVVRRRFSWLRRIYTIEDPQGTTKAELFGPILKPWTFEIRMRDRVEGFIRKKWSGLGKEVLTEADDFHLQLGPGIDPRLRPLCLGATFLIDFVHFERQ